MEAEEYIKLFEKLWNSSREQMALLERSLRAEPSDYHFKHCNFTAHIKHKGFFDVFTYLFEKKDVRMALLLIMCDAEADSIISTFIEMACQGER